MSDVDDVVGALPSEGDDVVASGRLPTGTLTLLLADVESSTRLWETEPATMTAAGAKLGLSARARVTLEAQPHSSA